MMPPIDLQNTPLFAADLDAIIQAVVILIAIIAWVLSQVSSVVKKMQIPGQPPQPRAPEVVDNAAPQEVPLSDEIEKFLREAAERRGGRPPAQPEMSSPPGQRTSGSRKNRRDGNRGRTASREPLAKPGEPVVHAEVVERAPLGQSVAAHVQSHLDNRAFAERASHLTSVAPETKLTDHLHQTFDHQVGSLGGAQLEIRSSTDVNATAATADGGQPATAGSNLAALLTDPKNLKNMIVLNEIFQRPEQRWE